MDVKSASEGDRGGRSCPRPRLRRGSRLPWRKHAARTLGLALFLAAGVARSLPAAPVPGEPDRSPFVPSIDKRVVRFEELSELEKKEGPHPANVWVYGRFTARTAVSGGVFLSSVNEGINFPDWEENLSVIDNPGDFLMRRVVFRTKSPLPEIRKGTKFTVPKARPARLVEVVRVDGLIARMVLEDGVTIDSQDGAGRPAKPEGDEEAHAAGFPARRVVPFRELGPIAKRERVHPDNLWTWGEFTARSLLREGIVTATPAGLESRRALERSAIFLGAFWVPLAFVIPSGGEPLHRAILRLYRPRAIEQSDRISIPQESPARVKRIFLAGGVLVWLDVDPPPPTAIPVELGSRPEPPGPPSAAPGPLSSPAGLAAEPQPQCR